MPPTTTTTVIPFEHIQHFIDDWGSISKKQIETCVSIKNPKLESQWAKYAEKFSDSPVRYMVHSAKYECDFGASGNTDFCKSATCVCNLLQNGHLLSYAYEHGKYGKAIYLSSAINKFMTAYQLDRCSGNRLLLVITKVALGKIADVNRNPNLAHLKKTSQSEERFFLKAPPVGYDCIKNDWEYALYDEKACLPCYAFTWVPCYFKNWRPYQGADLEKPNEGESLIIKEQNPKNSMNSMITAVTPGAFSVIDIIPQKKYRFSILGKSTKEAALYLGMRMDLNIPIPLDIQVGADIFWLDSPKLSRDQPEWRTCDFYSQNLTKINFGVLFCNFTPHTPGSATLLAYRLEKIDELE